MTKQRALFLIAPSTVALGTFRSRRVYVRITAFGTHRRRRSNFTTKNFDNEIPTYAVTAQPLNIAFEVCARESKTRSKEGKNIPRNELDLRQPRDFVPSRNASMVCYSQTAHFFPSTRRKFRASLHTSISHRNNTVLGPVYLILLCRFEHVPRFG